jgi:hypothetical protein
MGSGLVSAAGRNELYLKQYKYRSAAQPLGVTLGGYSRSFAITSLIVSRATDAIRESRIASQRLTGCSSHQSH